MICCWNTISVTISQHRAGCFQDYACWKEETPSWHVARRCININVVFSHNVCTLCPPWDKLKLKDISILLILLLSSLKFISKVLITFCRCNVAELCWEITSIFLFAGAGIVSWCNWSVWGMWRLTLSCFQMQTVTSDSELVFRNLCWEAKAARLHRNFFFFC